MKFAIRNYQSGDEDKIIVMFNEVFNQNRDLASWYWKYRDNPYGACRISLAVSEDGTLAAHYAGYPVKIYSTITADKPAEINTYQLGDKMTRKAYRAIGFGKSSLIARTYEHFRQSYVNESVPFCYGFAAHHSLRFGVTILKYADIGPVPYRRSFPGRLKRPIINSLKRICSSIKVTEVSSISSDWTDFFYSVAPHYGYLVRKDAPYLIWRYIRRPDKKYMIFKVKKKDRLAGWAVFFREGRKVIWGDALFKPGDPEAVKSLLAHVVSHPFARGADFVECWFPPRPLWWDNMLDELGFERAEQPDHIHFTVPIYNDLQIVETMEKHFYYSIGDSDLF